MVVRHYADNHFERDVSVVDWKYTAIGMLTIAGARVNSLPRYAAPNRLIAGGRS